MLKVTHLEVGTLAVFLRLALARKVVFPIPMEQFRNGALGQNWILSVLNGKSGLKIVDVGCGYSDMPHLLARGGNEVWGVDDFGIKSGDIYWLRGKNPQDLIAQYPEVRYVFERLGDAESSLGDGIFDVVISNQALHVAPSPHAPIWRDMLRILKKRAGSRILISMICNFASDGAPDEAIARLKRIQEMEKRIFDRLAAGEEVTLELDRMQSDAGQSFHRFSPALYVTYMAIALGVRPFEIPAELLAENYCTRVGTLTDPVSVGFNNARFSNNPEEAKSFRYGRYAPVLMELTWDDGDVAVPWNMAPEFLGWALHGAIFSRIGAPEKFAITPFGVSNPLVLVEDDNESVHMIARETTLPANAPISFQVLARPAGRSFLGVWIRGAVGLEDLAEVFFDLENGQVVSRSRYGGATVHHAEIEPVGNGWMRCAIQATPSRSTGNARFNILLRHSRDGSSQYRGQGGAGVCLASPGYSSASLLHGGATVSPDRQFDAMLFSRFKQYHDKEDIVEEVIASFYGLFLVADRSVAIDGGCHKGYHTFQLARCCRRVLAVDANREMYEFQKEHCATGQFRNCEVAHAALQDDPGVKEVVFHISDNFTGRSSLTRLWDKIDPTVTYRPVVTPATTIDHLVAEFNLEGVEFIKLDLEGGEYKAVLGADALLSRDRPALVYENSILAASQGNFAPEAMFDHLSARGYTLHLPSGAPVSKDGIFNFWYLFAFPNERKAELAGLLNRAYLGICDKYQLL